MTADEAVKLKTNCKKSSLFSILCMLKEVQVLLIQFLSISNIIIDAYDKLKNILFHIFKVSIQREIFPDSLKIAKVYNSDIQIW